MTPSSRKRRFLLNPAKVMSHVKASSNWFITVDLLSGYHQVAIKEQDRQYFNSTRHLEKPHLPQVLSCCYCDAHVVALAKQQRRSAFDNRGTQARPAGPQAFQLPMRAPQASRPIHTTGACSARAVIAGPVFAHRARQHHGAARLGP